MYRSRSRQNGPCRGVIVTTMAEGTVTTVVTVTIMVGETAIVPTGGAIVTTTMVTAIPVGTPSTSVTVRKTSKAKKNANRRIFPHGSHFFF